MTERSGRTALTQRDGHTEHGSPPRTLLLATGKVKLLAHGPRAC